MKKLYFKTTGYEPDISCIDPCRYKDKPSKGTMVGSSKCQHCKSCYGWDSEESWIKCLNYSLEGQGLFVELDENVIRKEKLEKLYNIDDL